MISLPLRIRTAFWSILLASVCLPVHADERPTRSGIDFFRSISRHLTGSNGRSSGDIKAAFRPVVQEARTSAVRVLCDGEETVLGTVVDARGYAVTKKSMLRAGRLECIVDRYRRVPATIAAFDEDYDIALLKLEADDLRPIEWAEEAPRLGAWLATVQTRSVPAAVGFLSAQARRIPRETVKLGVGLEDTSEGPRVTHVDPHSAAQESQLQPGDIIQSVDRQPMRNSYVLSQAIRSHRAGDRIEVVYLRDGEERTAHAVLRAERSMNEQARVMEELAGELSDRRTGFPVALQHDSDLKPKLCGSPLVNLDGQAVGINIARASRVASYAIPAATMRTVIAKLLPQ